MSDQKLIATIRLHLAIPEGEPHDLVLDSLSEELDGISVMSADAALEITDFQIDSLEDPAAAEKLTVIFFTDVDSVETYIQHVEVGPDDDAFEMAVLQAKREWGGAPSDWENATEIARFPGHIHEDGEKQHEPLFSSIKEEEDHVSECENCGNTDQDGSDDCIDCGLENAFR